MKALTFLFQNGERRRAAEKFFSFSAHSPPYDKNVAVSYFRRHTIIDY